jgi:enoyl-[acyl-carrier protein] reductase I
MRMNNYQFANKTFLITGIANKKSVAYFTAKTLQEFGARFILTVQNEEIKSKVQKLFPENELYILNAESEKEIYEFGKFLESKKIELFGFLHSIAFANYSEGIKPFHETKLQDYLQAQTISCFSLSMFSNALKNVFTKDASVVSISISSTKATNYGYMGPVKASLDATIAFLAKSFSLHSNVRFNAVCAGPLKTSASAGIPGYIESYLFAEQLTMRHSALDTQEVANTIIFLLSHLSSGINATGIVVDAGMSANYFDEAVVAKFNK